MNRFLFSVVLIFIVFNANAQLGCPTPFGSPNEVRRFHVAAGVGLTSLYGDIDKSETVGRAFFAKGDYQLKKGLYAGIEMQIGSLEAIHSFVDPREVTNNYFGAGLNVTLHPFEFFLERKTFKRSVSHVLLDAFYVGVGVMGIMNNYSSVYRDTYYDDINYIGPVPPGNYGPVESYDSKGVPVFKKKINSITLPTLNLGFAIPVNRGYSRNGRYWSILLNSQFNFANNDLLDGYTPYDAQFNRIGTKNDMFSMYSIGARYSL